MNERHGAGFAIYEAIIVVVAVGLLAAVGWIGYTKFFTAPATTDQAAVQSAVKNDQAATITKSSDIDTAAQSLDDPSFDSDGAAQLDADSEGF